jgi:hypothetical protein
MTRRSILNLDPALQSANCKIEVPNLLGSAVFTGVKSSQRAVFSATSSEFRAHVYTNSLLL